MGLFGKKDTVKLKKLFSKDDIALLTTIAKTTGARFDGVSGEEIIRSGNVTNRQLLILDEMVGKFYFSYKNSYDTLQDKNAADLLFPRLEALGDITARYFKEHPDDF